MGRKIAFLLVGAAIVIGGLLLLPAPEQAPVPGNLELFIGGIPFDIPYASLSRGAASAIPNSGRRQMQWAYYFKAGELLAFREEGPLRDTTIGLIVSHPAALLSKDENETVPERVVLNIAKSADPRDDRTERVKSELPSLFGKYVEARSPPVDVSGWESLRPEDRVRYAFFQRGRLAAIGRCHEKTGPDNFPSCWFEYQEPDQFLSMTLTFDANLLDRTFEIADAVAALLERANEAALRRWRVVCSDEGVAREDAPRCPTYRINDQKLVSRADVSQK